MHVDALLTLNVWQKTLTSEARALQTLTSLASNDEDERRKAVAFILDTLHCKRAKFRFISVGCF